MALEWPTRGGGRAPVQLALEHSWCMLEELVELTTLAEEEQLKKYAYLKIQTILQVQQNFLDS